MPRLPGGLLVCLGLIYLVACNNEGLDPGSTGERKSIELVETIRLGDEARGDTVIFGEIRSVAVNSNGDLIIADGRASVLYVFSTDGQLDHHFGGAGAGPGEFSNLQDAVVGPDDSVFVFDWFQRRVSVFSPDTFEFVYSLLIQETEKLTPGGLIGAVEQGMIFHYTPRGLTPVEMSAIESGALGYSAIMRTNRYGEPVDSLVGLRFSSPIIAAPDGSLFTNRGIVPRPFNRKSISALGPEGVLFTGWSENIDISKTSAGGQSLGRLQVTYQSTPVTEEDMDEVLEGLDSESRRLIRETDLPDTWPVISDFVVDDLNRVWIQLWYAKNDSSAQWIIAESDGSVIGELVLPVNVTLLAIRSRCAYGMLIDPHTGSPLVVGYDISGV